MVRRVVENRRKPQLNELVARCGLDRCDDVAHCAYVQEVYPRHYWHGRGGWVGKALALFVQCPANGDACVLCLASLRLYGPTRGETV